MGPAAHRQDVGQTGHNADAEGATHAEDIVDAESMALLAHAAVGSRIAYRLSRGARLA